MLWAFLAPAARDRGGGQLTVEGRNMDAPGTFRDTFAAISYEGQEGAPSFASIIDLPSPGCWRLTLDDRRAEGAGRPPSRAALALTASATHSGRVVTWVQVKRMTCQPAMVSMTSRSRSFSKREGERW